MDEKLKDPDYRPPLGEAIPLGIQHVLAMFAGNITVPLLIALAAGPQYITVLVQIALLAAGVATLIQTVGIGPVGSRLPIVQGTSFAYVGILTAAIKGGASLAAVFGASLVGGLFQIVLGYFIPQIRRFIPGLVSGVVVMTIGFTLLPVGIKYSAGCGAYPAGFCQKIGFGDVGNWAMALFVILVILLIRRFGKGVWSTASVFIGIVVGYLVAIPFGMLNPGKVANIGKADWIGLPGQWFGLEFSTPAALGLIGLMIIMAFITTVETVGDISGVTAGGADREPTDKELKGGIMADGVGSAIVALFGGLPNTSYSQNVGLVSFTRVMSRHVVTVGAIFLLLCGFIPKLAAVIGAMPEPVLGGAAVIMFGLIVSAGLKLVARSGLSTRNMLIAAISLGLGMGLWQVQQLAGAAGFGPLPADVLPAWSLPLFVSGIVVSGVAAAVLNAVLPEELEGA
ncbi:MAG: nucleobase:cation symporter-2 family protein [Rhodospirillaceae bacterium]|nr:nucleobase:cation symporter-2 family protein [Rhodospirillaceae bacterium]MCY4066966.1 nucleobase:cation symporter-2 family protein [Rhodospirillaceae bacterium]